MRDMALVSSLSEDRNNISLLQLPVYGTLWNRARVETLLNQRTEVSRDGSAKKAGRYVKRLVKPQDSSQTGCEKTRTRLEYL